MGKHTKGPWIRQGQGIVLHPVSKGSIITERIEAENWGIIGEWADSSNETEANARLIAAAPELLEALRECVARLCEIEELSRRHYDIPGSNQRANTISRALAVEAIRKATEE